VERHLNSRLKCDGAPLPARPPADLSTAEEKAAYRYLLDKVQRHAFAELVDLPALVLASQRLAHVRFCRAMANELKASGGLFIETEKAGLKPHPILIELRAAESSLNTSLGTLYLNPRSRANARGQGSVDPDVPISREEKAANDLLR
jgi:hypothetical protein